VRQEEPKIAKKELVLRMEKDVNYKGHRAGGLEFLQREVLLLCCAAGKVGGGFNLLIEPAGLRTTTNFAVPESTFLLATAMNE
jgi:hypothetical protein